MCFLSLLFTSYCCTEEMRRSLSLQPYLNAYLLPVTPKTKRHLLQSKRGSQIQQINKIPSSPGVLFCGVSTESMRFQRHAQSSVSLCLGFNDWLNMEFKFTVNIHRTGPPPLFWVPSPRQSLCHRSSCRSASRVLD